MTYLDRAKSLHGLILESLIHEKPVPFEAVDEYNYIMDSILNLGEHQWTDRYKVKP